MKDDFKNQMVPSSWVSDDYDGSDDSWIQAVQHGVYMAICTLRFGHSVHPVTTKLCLAYLERYANWRHFGGILPKSQIHLLLKMAYTDEGEDPEDPDAEWRAHLDEIESTLVFPLPKEEEL